MNYLSQQSTNNILFDALMSGIRDEAFLLELASMQLIYASQSAYKSLDEGLAALQQQPLQTTLGVTEETLTAFVSSHQLKSQLPLPNKSSDIRFSSLNHLNIAVIEVDNRQYLLAIKYANQDVAQANLDENDTRFKVLVQNTLGLVFEFQMDKRGISFDYLSDGCRALLGLDAESLKKAPQQFFDFMDKDDRMRLEANINASAKRLSMLNWEGRFWIDEWQDTKWVNVRASPRKLANGVIQWSGIMTNITQGKLEKIELEQSRQRLAELSAHLNSAKEEERTRIAREIHDDLGGNLTVIKIGLASLLKHLPKDQQPLIEKTQNLKSIVDATFETVHRISGDLRPNILELGIVAALEWQTKEFEKQFDIPCTFVTDNHDEKGTTEQATTLFRVCQEAMSNIAKYAQATNVEVSLFFSPKEIKLLIADNGVGIHPRDVIKQDAFGLRGMEERVAALRGKFSIDGTPGRGTNVTVILPNDRPSTIKTS